MANEERELQKHTLNLFKGDYEKLQSYYPDLGAAAVIRRIIDTYIKQLEEPSDVSKLNIQLKL